MNLENINKIAFELLGKRSSHMGKDIGNKYYHGQRVAKLALTLRKIILPEFYLKDEILTAAAIFHDCMNGYDNHCALGAAVAVEALREECSSEELHEIEYIIRNHDNRKNAGNKQNPFSDILKIHQDADHLDHFGTFDIWTSFLYVIPNDWTMPQMAQWLHEGRPHEREKFLPELNFDLSKKIYHEKFDFLRDFARRFYAEAQGEIYNLEEILKEF